MVLFILNRRRGRSIVSFLWSWINPMLPRIVTSLGPFSCAFVRLTTLDATTTWLIAVAFLPSHGTFCACLPFFRHDHGASHVLYNHVQLCTILGMYEVEKKCLNVYEVERSNICIPGHSGSPEILLSELCRTSCPS